MPILSTSASYKSINNKRFIYFNRLFMNIHKWLIDYVIDIDIPSPEKYCSLI